VPGLTWETAADAVLRRFAQRYELEEESGFDDATMALALELEPRHAA
jgi:hypothetical protein